MRYSSTSHDFSPGDIVDIGDETREMFDITLLVLDARGWRLPVERLTVEARRDGKSLSVRDEYSAGPAPRLIAWLADRGVAVGPADRIPWASTNGDWTHPRKPGCVWVPPEVESVLRLIKNNCPSRA